MAWSQRRLVRPLASLCISADSPPGADGRASAGGVYAGSDPAVAAARAGQAGQFLKKVNWNGSPMKISRPPGIVAANAYRACSAPPDGSAPLRHLYICL